jgi:hyperosmotically inducible periplasmic protein
MRLPRIGTAALVALAAAAGAARADIVTVDESPLERSTGTLDGDTAISYTADTSDRAVAERVMDALANDPALEGAAITVLVDEGQVRLSGTARDEDQAAYAREVAQDAAGPAVAVSAESLQPGTGAY